MPIRLLDRITVGQIAAGEVVERPLSVVKELVENALDAGARRIAVSVERGGLDAVDVLDDGLGIRPEELELAFARHATSKLGDATDLNRIATLGFRGEGLASIAAVARVRLVSRTSSDDVGYAVDAFETDVTSPEPLAAPPGTRVTVRDLFANVPARREYLRTPAAEFARISNFPQRSRSDTRRSRSRSRTTAAARGSSPKRRRSSSASRTCSATLRRAISCRSRARRARISRCAVSSANRAPIGRTGGCSTSS